MTPPYLIDCRAYGGPPVSSPTILAALDDNRIVSVKPRPDGRFQVREECDGYFRGYLTREQLHALADELHQIADGKMPVDE